MPTDSFTDDSQDSTKRVHSKSSSSYRRRTRKQTRLWSTQEATKLVLLVSLHEQLWNGSHELYRQHKINRLVWETIGDRLGRSSIDCVNKWGSLRSNIKARHDSIKRGSTEIPSAEDLAEPYCHMGFVISAMKRPPRMRLRQSTHDQNDQHRMITADQINTTNDQTTFPLMPPLLSLESPTEQKPEFCLIDQHPPTTTSTFASAFDPEPMPEMARHQQTDDEWDKTTTALAEHMRNTVAEFPMLADEFRMKLFQLMVDVQQKRSEMR